MAVNLSGGNGKLSFEEWRRQRGVSLPFARSGAYSRPQRENEGTLRAILNAATLQYILLYHF